MSHKLFFELIRLALGNQSNLSRTPSAKEWKEMYQMAQEQSLLGICFEALQRMGGNSEDGWQKIGIPEMVYLRWMGLAAKIRKRNEVVNRQCKELQERIARDGLRSYIMKGQAVGTLYKVDGFRETVRDISSLRQSGDIDIYIEGGRKKVVEYAKTIGEVSGINELEMHVEVYKDTEVEFHYRPFIMRNPFTNRRLQRFFQEEAEACFAHRVKLGGEEMEICAPTLRFNIIHQMAHIRLHLFTEGIGMRQLMDFYFVLRSVREESDVQGIQEVIHDLGLTRFACALMWVMKTVFLGDLDRNSEKELFLGYEPNEEDGQLLLQEVMQGGNFGKYNEEQNNRKTKASYRLWALLIRNLRLSRFDRWDWFWGPLWRVGQKVKVRG